MKIWLKFLIAIILGLIFGFFLPNSLANYYNNFLDFFSRLAINSILYLTALYVLIKTFLGFINLRKNKLTKKVVITFFLCIIISVFISIIVTIGFMNLNLFQLDKNFPQKSDKTIPLSSFGNIILRVINGNIFSSFEGHIFYILPVIFISVIFAYAAFHSEKKGLYFIESIESLDSILDKIIRQILEFFPIGAIFVFTSFIKKISFSYNDVLFILNPLFAIIIICIFFILLYTLCLYMFLKKNISNFYLGTLGTLLFSVITGNAISSIIPLTEHLKKNIGVKKEIADTLGPMGVVLNKSGTVIVSTVVLLSLIYLYSGSEFTLNLQLVFFILIFLFSFILDGSAHNTEFLVLVASILNFDLLHLEQESYLLFYASIPIFSRIGLLIDNLSTSLIIAITAKITNNLEQKRYIEYI